MDPVPVRSVALKINESLRGPVQRAIRFVAGINIAEPSTKLIEISCASSNLGDRPVTNGSAQSCHVQLKEQVPEG